MKAAEVLRQYAAGERDFHRVNLRGQYFKGKDLSGADFSEADIRGANFSNATLIGTNFSGTKAGLQRRWVVSLLIASLLVAALSGFAAAAAGVFVAVSFSPANLQKVTNYQRVILLIVFVVFFTLIIRDGITSALKLALGLVFGLGLAFALGFLLAFSSDPSAAAFALIQATAFALAFAVALATALALCGRLAFVVALVGALLGAGIGAFLVTFSQPFDRVFVFTFALSGALAFAFLAGYVGWQALAEDRKFSLIRNIAVDFAAKGGTSFRGATLTNANFTQATLKGTDFQGAILTQTCWFQVKHLDLARVKTTYLEKLEVRLLVVTGEGRNGNFDGINLRGIYLRGANLADASFIGAELSEANLQEANLSRSKLVQTQLDKTDLTGACLTGACIEDWGITSDTKLDGVECKYVFMRWVKPGDPDPNPRRKPDNCKEEFEDGDFADFIRPLVDTLDLYHNRGVDPRAIAISFKQLAENHPETELEIVAMEKRGTDKLLLRVRTAQGADRSTLNAEYFVNYNQLKTLAEQELQAIVAEKDSRIRRLEVMVETALQRPSFYSQTYQNYELTVSERKIDIHQSGASIGVGYSENVEAEQVGGTIHNYAPEQKQTLAEAAAEIQELLKQLQTQGYSPEDAQQKVASDLAKRIQSNPESKSKLAKWGQYLGDAAANGLIGEAVVTVLKLAAQFAGIPLP
jgi:uncharacterized protein YjbI with pentapeptide repeats